MSTYTPYSERMPRTDDLHVLREELSLQRELHGVGSSQAQEAFENLFATSCRIGRPLDRLKRFSPDESERFFARTRVGTAGHVYWLGANNGFRKNDGGYVRANRWWWQQINGPVSNYHDIFPGCGQKKCINPEHQEHGRDERRRIYTTDQMIGAIQVISMRLEGKPPRAKDWATLGGKPSAKVYKARFGSWVNALVAAGIIDSRSDLPRASPPIRRATTDRCIESLREARRFLGHLPTERHYSRYKPLRDHLVVLGAVSSQTTIKKYLGTWPEAVERAFGK